VTVDNRRLMLASLINPSLRVLTWCCVILLAVLSLLPAQQMVRTGFPGRLEHFVAYAGSAANRRPDPGTRIGLTATLEARAPIAGVDLLSRTSSKGSVAQAVIR
jgi:hypothetical protein